MTEITWMTAILLVALIAGGVSLFARGKKKTSMMWGTVALISLGILAVGYASPSTLPFLQNKIGVGAPLTVGEVGVPSEVPITTGLCVRTDPVTVTFSSVNKETGVSTGGTHRYRVDNARWNTIADAGTATATPGQRVDILYMNASTSNNYYSALSSFIVPCQATFDTSTTAGAKLSQNGTLTITIYNTNDAVIDGAGVNLTLAAGDTPTIKFKTQGQYQREHPGFLVVAEYNRTSIDNVKVLTFAGRDISETSVPSGDSISNTQMDRKAYLIPAITGADFKEGTIYIDVDDSTNPGIESDINLRWYSLNYYVDETDNNAIKGPSAFDEANTVTSLHQQNVTIHTT